MKHEKEESPAHEKKEESLVHKMEKMHGKAHGRFGEKKRHGKKEKR